MSPDDMNEQQTSQADESFANEYGGFISFDDDVCLLDTRVGTHFVFGKE